MYTVSPQKWTTQLMPITSSKLTDFHNSFNVGKMSNCKENPCNISHHTRCVLRHFPWKAKVQICNKLRTRSTFVMVFVGISKLSLTDLILVHPGVKINGGYYRDMLLSQQLLPVMRDVSGDFFIFQQDSAPAHRARDTV